jgi:signal transduction histidine kinase
MDGSVNLEERGSDSSSDWKTADLPDDQQRTFLVVDDEPDIRDAIQRMFRQNYRVLTAESASGALELVESEPVQVVMTDQRMPEMTGIEFLAQLRDEYPHIVRVLFTGYSDIDNVIDAINEGHVYRYISKPWKPAELKLFVEQAFEYYESERERDRLVEQLQETNQQLEERNELLREANEELKQLDRMKTVFMEVVSHELNTPIAITLGYAFLLKKQLGDQLDEVATKALDGIDSSARRLKQISNRIFKMLSEEGPASTLELESIDVDKFTESLRDQVAPFLDKRDQQLSLEVDQTVDSIRADEEKLFDIFVNLVMNAIKFSHDGQVIDLTVRPSGDNERYIDLEVLDRGIGITDEDLSQIFDAFFSTFKSKHHSSGSFEFGKRGIGLGLPVAQKFTQMHGGEISVESEEGEGSRFTVTLPLDPDDIDEAAPQTSADLTSTPLT